MSSISADSICYTARSTIVPKLASVGSSKLRVDMPCEPNGPCASSPLSVSPRTVLSYKHYRRDLRDKRHLGDECSPRRRDKSVSLVSRFFSWTPRISTCPPLVRRGRSSRGWTVLSAAIIPALLTPCSGTYLPVSSSQSDHLEPGGMGSIGVVLIKLGPDNGIGPVYKIPHTPDAIRPFYKSAATTRGYVVNLLAGASMWIIAVHRDFNWKQMEEKSAHACWHYAKRNQK